MTKLVWRAFCGLIVYDLLKLHPRSFAALHRRIQQWPVARREVTPGTDERIREAINRACVWYPRTSLCLPRSAVVTCLLRDAGVPAQMVIGVQKIPFKAHAWVEVSGRVVNDKEEVKLEYMVMDRL
jgi:hypothetical protein